MGREASWAAGGILTPVHPWSYPEALARLAAASLELYPALTTQLAEETGIDAGLRRGGLLAVVESDDPDALTRVQENAQWFQRMGQKAEVLQGAALHQRVPQINPALPAGLWVPEVAQVRNNRLVRALAASAARRGARLHEGAGVDALIGGRGCPVEGVRAGALRVSAGTVVLAAGAWSGALLRGISGSDQLPIEPARGQMLVLEVSPTAQPLEAIVLGGDHYAVPRPDGRVLFGSTVEYVGFDKRVTTEAVAVLSQRAVDLVPALADARFLTTYAGLRPATPDRLPFLGPISGIEGVYVASGHFRNGILLAPITAQLVADELTGSTPALDMAPYRPGRPLPS